jgi:hypothetical protein
MGNRIAPRPLPEPPIQLRWQRDDAIQHTHMRVGSLVMDPPSRVQRKTRTRLIFAITAVGGALLIFAGFNTIHDSQAYVHDTEALRTHGITTVGGVVVASFAPSDEAGGGWTSLRIRFTDQSGRSVVATTGHFGQSGERVGQSVDIIYDSENPELIDLVDNRQYDGTSDDGVIFGKILIVAGAMIALGFGFLASGSVAAVEAAILRWTPGPPALPSR